MIQERDDKAAESFLIEWASRLLFTIQSRLPCSLMFANSCQRTEPGSESWWGLFSLCGAAISEQINNCLKRGVWHKKDGKLTTPTTNMKKVLTCSQTQFAEKISSFEFFQVTLVAQVWFCTSLDCMWHLDSSTTLHHTTVRGIQVLIKTFLPASQNKQTNQKTSQTRKRIISSPESIPVSISPPQHQKAPNFDVRHEMREDNSCSYVEYF